MASNYQDVIARINAKIAANRSSQQNQNKTQSKYQNVIDRINAEIEEEELAQRNLQLVGPSTVPQPINEPKTLTLDKTQFYSQAPMADQLRVFQASKRRQRDAEERTVLFQRIDGAKDRIADLEQQRSFFAGFQNDVINQLQHEKDLLMQQGAETDYQKISEIEKKIEDANKPNPQLEVIDGQISAIEDEIFSMYGSLFGMIDFDTLSQYKSTRKKDENGNYVESNLFDGFYNTDEYGDILYDYINGDEYAIYHIENPNYNSDRIGAGESDQMHTMHRHLRYLTDDEKKIFNYIYAVDGKDAAYAFTDELTPYLNARLRQQATEDVQDFSKNHEVLGSVYSTLMAPTKVFSAAGQVVDYLGDGKIDQNAYYNRYSYIPTAIRGTVSEEIEKTLGEHWGPVGSFAYNVGMSMGDFLVNTAAGGGNSALAMALMGSGAAADTVISAKDRGLSDEQALALGLTAAAVEALTEKISLGALFEKIPLGKNAVVNYIGKNMLAEGGEEATASLANWLADAIVSQDQSEWNQMIQYYMSEDGGGLSENKAFGKAFGERMKTLGADFLGGMASGGALGGTSAAIQSVSIRRINTNLDSLINADEAGKIDAAAKFVDSVAKQTGENTYAVNASLDFIRSKTQELSAEIKTIDEAGTLSDPKKQEAAQKRRSELQDRLDKLVATDEMIRRKRAEIEAARKITDHADTDESEFETHENVSDTDIGTSENSNVNDMNGETVQDDHTSIHDENETYNRYARSAVGDALEMAQLDVDKASEKLLDAYGGDMRAAVDALRLTDREIRNGNSRFQNSDIKSLREIDVTLRRNNAKYITNAANNLQKSLAKYGVTNVVVGKEGFADYSNVSRKASYNRNTGVLTVSPYLNEKNVLVSSVVHEMTHHGAVHDLTLVNDAVSLIDSARKSGVLEEGELDYGNYEASYRNEAVSYMRTSDGQAAVKHYTDGGMSAAAAQSQVIKDYINEELAADFVGKLVSMNPNSREFKMFAGENRTVLQRILDAITGFIRRLRGENAGADVRQYERAAELLRDILDRGTKNYKKTTSSDDGTSTSADSNVNEVKQNSVMESDADLSDTAPAEASDVADDNSEDELTLETFRWEDDVETETVTPKRRIGASVSEGNVNLINESDHVVYNSDGEAVASDEGDGSTRWSIDTYQKSGRETLMRYIQSRVDSGALSKADGDDIVDTMDRICKLCDSMTGEYKAFGEWSYASVEVDKDGNPVFSVIKPNGEYIMNLDFSLVCKKRRALDAVFNEMIRRGVISKFDIGQDKIVKINDIIRKNDLEVACSACFVDAKRFRQSKVADDFVKMYNSLVRSMAKGSDTAYFNFGGDSSLPDVRNGIDTLSDSDLDMTTINKVLAAGGKSVRYKIAKHLAENPSDRKLLSRGDFMFTRGFNLVKKVNPDVLSLYNSKKGSGGPKASFGDVQYLSDIIRSGKFNADKAYSVGGVRVQSFSDYVARLVFDYVQMVGDLAAKLLPAHAYTKEVLFVKQFGLTGMKINMSLMPALGDGKYAGLNADGSYAWAKESFDYDAAMEIQSDPEYAKNCGTIAVGISDQHIWKLLSDPNIRMVIPYHKSGINPVVAEMNKINRFTNYTNDQNTRYKDGKKLSAEDAKGVPNFNELMHNGMNAIEASRAYVEWCESKGYKPKFDRFVYNADGTFNENYYKLLEDFTTMVDGVYHPQGAVKAVFPTEGSAFGSMEQLIREGLEQDAVDQFARDEKVGGIVDEVVAMLEGGDDVRSSKDVADVRSTEEKLRAENEYLKRQFMSRNGDEWAKAVSPEDVRRVSREIAKDLPGVAAGAVEAEFAEVVKVLQRKLTKDYSADARYRDAMEAAKAAAAKLIMQTDKVTVNNEWLDIRDLKKKLRDTKVYVSENVASEFPDWQSVRKEISGALSVVTTDRSALPLDSFYSELAEEYPEYFPAEIKIPQQQMERVIKVAKELKEIRQYNHETLWVDAEDTGDTISAEMANSDLVQSFANVILAKYNESAMETLAAQLRREKDSQRWDSNSTRNMIAELQREIPLAQENAKQTIERHMRATRQKVNQFMALYNEQMDALKAEVEQANADAEWLSNRLAHHDERNKITTQRKRYSRNLKTLYNLLTKPTDKRHIPEGLQRAVIDLLSNFSGVKLDNGQTIDPEVLRNLKGRFSMENGADAVGALERLVNVVRLNKTSADFSVSDGFIDDLQRTVDLAKEILNEPKTLSKGELQDQIDYYAAYGQNYFAQREFEYLSQVNRVLSMVQKYINDSNKVFLGGKREYAADMADQVAYEMRNRPKRSNVPANDLNGADNRPTEFAYDHMQADTFWHMFGDFGDMIMKSYRKAQNYQMEHEAEYADWVKKNIFDVFKNGKGKRYNTHDLGWGGELVTVSADGKKFEITKAQLMSCYVTWNQPEGKTHMTNGGVFFKSQQGEEVESRHVVFTDESFAKLMENLSEQDKTVCDKIVKFLSKRGAAWGNEASMYLYGYKKFMKDYYFPIMAAKSALPVNWDQMTEFSKLESKGMTKARKGDAKNAILIDDFFDVADNHIRNMAAYSAFAPLNNDVRRIFDMGKAQSAVKLVLGDKTTGGKNKKMGGWGYLVDFLQNVDQNKVMAAEQLSSSKALRILSSMYKRQAVSASLSTALKQPTSYVRAWNVLDGKYLTMAFADKSFVPGSSEYKRIMKDMAEHSGVAKMKLLGYSDTGSAKSLRAIYDSNYSMLGDEFTNAFARNAVKGYEKTSDLFMVAAETMDKWTWIRLWKACELEVDAKNKGLSRYERMEAVAELFNQVIGETQVVDTVLDSTPALRNSDGLTQQMYAFMKEPIKTVNTVFRAWDDVKTGKKGAKKAMTKALVTFAVSNMILEPLISALFGMLRDEEDEEGIFLQKLGNSMFGIPMNGEKFNLLDVLTSESVSSIYNTIPIVEEFADVLFSRLQGYDIERMDVTGLTKAIDAVVALCEYDSKKTKTFGNTVSDVVTSFAGLFGIPAYTLKRDVSAAFRLWYQWTDDYEAQWELNKLFYNLNNGSARSQKNFYDIIGHVIREGDEDAYQYIRENLSNVFTSDRKGLSANDMLKYMEGKKVEFDYTSRLWNIELQANFDLPQFVSNMKVEPLITDVYRKTGDSSVLPSPPSDNFKVKADAKFSDKLVWNSENDADEDSRTVTFETQADLAEYTEKVGDYRYKTLLCFVNSDVYKNLNYDQKVFAINKAYDFAVAKYKTELYPDYDPNNDDFAKHIRWNSNPEAVANMILRNAQKYKPKK